MKALAPQHPEKEEKEPFAPLRWERRRDGINGGDTHTGMTTEEFSRIVRDWIASARNPKTGRPYNEMIYPPMVELLGYRRKRLQDVHRLRRRRIHADLIDDKAGKPVRYPEPHRPSAGRRVW